jgi:hypothetical protein
MADLCIGDRNSDRRNGKSGDERARVSRSGWIIAATTLGVTASCVALRAASRISERGAARCYPRSTLLERPREAQHGQRAEHLTIAPGTI